MRVLVLHSRYLSGPVSGENRVVDDEVELLRQAGHDVLAWTPSVGDTSRRLRTAANAIWSRQEAGNVRRIVLEHRPEVVHVHSLYPRLSPSVIRAAAGLGVPILMTLHNFRLMCLPATFMRDGAACEECAGRIPWRGVVHGCYRESRSASATLASSLALHRATNTFDQVRLFVAVSAFVRDKYIQNGIDPERIRLKDNFSWPLPRRTGSEGGFLVLGRLSPEKGVDTAIAALPGRARLTVVGDGPERQQLEALARPNVSFIGGIEPSEVPARLSASRALLVPSRCYEGAPRSIIEAFAAGVPVIASRIGGLGELVEDGVNGLLVPPDDPKAWRSAIERLLDDGESERLGRGAFECWQERFSPSIATQRLEQAYAAARGLDDPLNSRGRTPVGPSLTERSAA